MTGRAKRVSWTRFCSLVRWSERRRGEGCRKHLLHIDTRLWRVYFEQCVCKKKPIDIWADIPEPILSLFKLAETHGHNRCSSAITEALRKRYVPS